MLEINLYHFERLLEKQTTWTVTEVEKIKKGYYVMSMYNPWVTLFLKLKLAFGDQHTRASKILKSCEFLFSHSLPKSVFLTSACSQQVLF